MKAAPFDYARPATLAEACALAATPGAAFLAGGQSLVPLMALRHAGPSCIVDLGAVPGLDTLAATSDGPVRIGARVTHAALEDWAADGPLPAFLRTVATGIGFRSVRNLGTIGGSLAHADPRADWIAALFALGATIETTGPEGDRALPIDGFIPGPNQTALLGGELIRAVVIPGTSPKLAAAFSKLRPKVGSFAELLTAAVFDADSGLARVSLGAAGTAPCLLPTLCDRLGQDGLRYAVSATRTAIETALAVETTLDPVDRRRAAVMVERNLRRLGDTLAT